MPVLPPRRLHHPFQACRASAPAAAAWLALAVLGLAAAPVRANDESAALVAQAGGVDAAEPMALDDELLVFAAGELGREKVVKGAPYCADAVHESIQWLADEAGGTPNRIVKRNQSRLCRDGDGRTRQEVTRNGRPVVYLRDPLAREGWVLDPQRKTARRLSVAPVLPQAHPQDRSAWRDYSDRMRAWASELSRSIRGMQPPPVPPVPPAPAVPGVAGVPQPPSPPSPPAVPAVPEKASPVAVQRSEVVVSDPAASGGTRREVRVMVLRPGDVEAGAMPVPPAPPAPPAVVWRAQSLSVPRGPAVSTLLPPKDIEGLRASGERSTWTIEAGRIGNERPIQIVREVWTSHDLGLTLSSRDADPRSGEQIYRLQNIRRGEPDAALMRVPPEYTVQGRNPARPPASGVTGRG